MRYFDPDDRFDDFDDDEFEGPTGSDHYNDNVAAFNELDSDDDDFDDDFSDDSTETI